MRKVYLFLLILSVFTGFIGSAQCLTSPNGQWPSATFTPTCNGTTQNIVTNGFAGEYSVVNVTAGNSYTFSSSIATDYITISNSGGTTAFAFGTGPVTWTSTLTGTIRFYTHTNSACGDNTTNRTRAVSCTLPPTTPTDLSAMSVTGPTTVCVAPTDTVFVTIKNTGINPIDFSTSNATVAVNITGANTQTLNATLNTGTLAPGATQVVQMAPFANFSTPGTYNMSATVTIAGDGVAANNTTSSSVTLSQAPVPWAESFTTATTPAGWNTAGWSFATNHGVTTNGIYANLYSSNTTQQFRTLPIGPLVGNEVLTFDFRILNWSGFPTGGTPSGNWGNVKVQVSTNCGLTFTDLGTLDNTNHTQTGVAWSNKSFSLTGLAGQTVIIRILATWASGDYYMDFDNFNISATPPIDLTITGLTGLSNCPSPSQPLSAVIKNVGLNTLNFASSPATITMNITGAGTQTLTATVNTGTLAAGASQTVLLTPNATMGASGTYNTNTTVTIAGDGNGTNNSYITSAVIAPTATSPWSETFATTTTPAGWNTTGWFIDPVHGRTTNGLTRNLYSFAIDGEFSTISVGPLGPSDQLSFDYRIMNWSGYPTGGTPTGNWGNFIIQISTNCGVTYTAIDTIDQTNHVMNGANWTTLNFPLSAYAGQFIKVRIKAAWVSGDYYIDFDNFNVRPLCNSTPVPGTVTAAQNPVCIGASTILKVTGQSNAAGITYQWQSSSDSLVWNNITGATDTAYTASPSAVTYYRVMVICSNTTPASSAPTPGLKITLTNPQVLTTTPGSRCGPGTVALSATSNAGSVLNWYSTATGGQPLFTGANFTTPVINTTTTYYVAGSSGGVVTNVGKAAYTSTDGTNTAGAYLIFDAISAFTLNSVVVYPGGNGAGTLTINLQNSSGVTLQTATVNLTGASTPVATTVPLNFNITPGTNYRLVYGSSTGGVTSLYREFSGTSFPYTVPGIVSITNGSLVGYYYYFYNWQIATGCESARQAVTATVTAGPAFNVTDSVTICNNAVQALNVSTTLSNFDSYVWTPSANLFTDAAATIPYTGGSATTVYVRNSTGGTYWYTVNAVNNTTSCTGLDSVKVVVLPANVTIQATPTQICTQGTSFLSITPATGYQNAQFQWQMSTNGGTTYTNVAGATASTLATPVLTQTTMFKLQIKNSAGVICQEPTVTITVNTPQVLTSAGAINCGPGSVTLNATGSAGTTLNWYTSAQGGAPVGTGTTFTTPNLTATTTYYVSATSGGAIQSLGAVTATQLGGPSSQTTINAGIRFDVLNPNVTVGTLIQSVDIFPTAPVGTAFQIAVIQGPSTAGPIKNGANGQPLVYNGVTTVSGSAANPVAQTVPVNFQVPSGFDYIMVFKTTNPGALQNGSAVGAAFPYSIPAEISLTGSTTAGAYQYFYNWRIGSGCESPRTAVSATISANTAITTQPTAQSVCSGATLQLTVVGVGAGVTYQWIKDGQPVPNSNNDTLTIVNAQTTNAGVYTVTLTGSCGTVTSLPVNVNVSGQNTWLGAVSSDWHTAANWCGSIPTQTSDIVISAGTPYAPIVSGIAEVRNITINSGASIGVNANGFLNIWGNYQNQGSLNAQNGFIAFKGTTIKTATSMNIGTVVINGTGGVSLLGDWTVGTLILETGNVRLNGSSLSLTASAMGSPVSHIINNGVGSVRALNVTSGRTIGVGADSLSYNPVVITNGQGRDYTVRVVTGIQPTITLPARAINRTWTVLASQPVPAPVELTFHWADAHGNASVTAGGDMEVGVNSNAPGGIWNILTPPGGLTPSGGTTNRGLTVLTTTFGNFVVSSPGGFTYPLSTPGVDVEVSSVQLMPNLVQSQTTMRVKLTRSARVQWSVVDASGKVVRQWAGSYTAGTTDEKLNLINLSKGAYFLMGHTQKGRTQTVRLVKE